MRKNYLLKGGLAFLVLALGITLSGCSLKQSKITPEEAKAKAYDFIKVITQPGTEFSIKEVVEEEVTPGLKMYKISVSVPNNQEDIPVYMTLDGEKYISQILDISDVESEIAANNNGQVQGEAAGQAVAPKSDKPAVDLYVMSFCPFGVQAENVMKPVYDILGDKADINIRFIASLEGNDLNAVKSLHGPIEGKEDARQLCVIENYGKDKFWEYVMKINETCYPIYSKGDAEYDTCWQKAARDSGIDPNKLDTCMAQKGADLIKGEDSKAKENSVSGSPTLIINGTKVSPARTPEGYKTAICDAFNEKPEECSQVLSSEGTAASGGCN